MDALSRWLARAGSKPAELLRFARVCGVERVITPYIEQLHSVIDVAPLKAAPLKIVVDAMHGSGAGIIPKVLAGGAIEVVEIRSDHNPNFPGMDQPEPIEIVDFRANKGAFLVTAVYGNGTNY